MLKFLLEKGKYVILLAVVSTFLASVATFIWGTVRMITNVVNLIAGLITHEGVHSGVQMIASLDSLLLAIVLYIFSVAIYELFFGKINVPDWLVIENLDGLKEKLASVIILILAVTFLEHLVEWKEAKETLMFGVSIAAVLISLVFYMQHKKGEKD
ncbi:MAG: YqhA family protein [Nitrospinae bacterium]|nr:YqhA family protein [Nitrospinota bacterium]